MQFSSSRIKYSKMGGFWQTTVRNLWTIIVHRNVHCVRINHINHFHAWFLGKHFFPRVLPLTLHWQKYEKRNNHDINSSLNPLRLKGMLASLLKLFTKSGQHCQDILLKQRKMVFIYLQGLWNFPTKTYTSVLLHCAPCFTYMYAPALTVFRP